MNNEIKQKKYYDVRMEALVPSLITYRVYAEDENDALSKIDKMKPSSIIPHIVKKQNIKATIYEAGSLIIKLVKKWR